MTDQQARDLLKLFPGAEGKPVHTLRKFAGESGDIEDPFDKGDQVFAAVAIQIKLLIPRVADRLLGADWSLDAIGFTISMEFENPSIRRSAIFFRSHHRRGGRMLRQSARDSLTDREAAQGARASG